MGKVSSSPLDELKLKFAEIKNAKNINSGQDGAVFTALFRHYIKRQTPKYTRLNTAEDTVVLVERLAHFIVCYETAKGKLWSKTVF